MEAQKRNREFSGEIREFNSLMRVGKQRWSLLSLAGSAGGPRPLLNGWKGRNGMDEEVAKRRAIVRSNPNLSARELCERFDHRQVSRTKAVAGCRNRVVDEGPITRVVSDS